jgi:hypothetical protein
MHKGPPIQTDLGEEVCDGAIQVGVALAEAYEELLQSTCDELSGRESPVAVGGSLAPKVCQ